jgi:hypothetical protein
MVGGDGWRSRRAHQSWCMATGRRKGKGRWRRRALFADQAGEHIVEVPSIWDQMTRRNQGDAELKQPSYKREEAEVEAGTNQPLKVGEKRRNRRLGVRSSCFEIGS